MNHQEIFGSAKPIRQKIRSQKLQVLPQWARHLGMTLAVSGSIMFFMNNALLDRTEGLHQIRSSLLSFGHSQCLGVGAGVLVFLGFKAKKRGRE